MFFVFIYIFKFLYKRKTLWTSWSILDPLLCLMRQLFLCLYMSSNLSY